MSESRLSFVQHALALEQILQPCGAPPDQPYGWTMGQAVERVTGGAWASLKAAEWREVAVYLAMQYIRASSPDSDSDRLAIMRIRTALRDLDDQYETNRRRTAQADSVREAAS